MGRVEIGVGLSLDVPAVQRIIVESSRGKPLSLANLLLVSLGYLKEQLPEAELSGFRVGKGRPEGVVYQGEEFRAQLSRSEDLVEEQGKVRSSSEITFDPCAENLDYPTLIVKFDGKRRKINSPRDCILPVAFSKTERGQTFYFAEALEKREGFVLTDRFFAAEVWRPNLVWLSLAKGDGQIGCALRIGGETTLLQKTLNAEDRARYRNLKGQWLSRINLRFHPTQEGVRYLGLEFEFQERSRARRETPPSVLEAEAPVPQVTTTGQESELPIELSEEEKIKAVTAALEYAIRLALGRADQEKIIKAWAERLCSLVVDKCFYTKELHQILQARRLGHQPAFHLKIVESDIDRREKRAIAKFSTP